MEKREKRLYVSKVMKQKREENIKRITSESVSYTHLRAHETDSYLVCRLLLEKKKKKEKKTQKKKRKQKKKDRTSLTKEPR